MGAHDWENGAELWKIGKKVFRKSTATHHKMCLQLYCSSFAICSHLAMHDSSFCWFVHIDWKSNVNRCEKAQHQWQSTSLSILQFKFQCPLHTYCILTLRPNGWHTILIDFPFCLFTPFWQFFISVLQNLASKTTYCNWTLLFPCFSWSILTIKRIEPFDITIINDTDIYHWQLNRVLK